jgi:GNAT superfamily N-acetyltransferase
VSLLVEVFDKGVHNRAPFDCGNDALNAYLQTQAGKHQRMRVARVFVLVNDLERSRILGFYALSASHIARRDISQAEARKLPRHPVPTITLGRLAVDRTAAGRGYGTLLLVDAIRRCALVGEQAGVYAIVVDAKNERAKAVYERFGFRDVDDRQTRLYLPLATALKAVPI